MATIISSIKNILKRQDAIERPFRQQQAALESMSHIAKIVERANELVKMTSGPASIQTALDSFAQMQAAVDRFDVTEHEVHGEMPALKNFTGPPLVKIQAHPRSAYLVRWMASIFSLKYS